MVNINPTISIITVNDLNVPIKETVRVGQKMWFNICCLQEANFKNTHIQIKSTMLIKKCFSYFIQKVF